MASEPNRDHLVICWQYLEVIARRDEDSELTVTEPWNHMYADEMPSDELGALLYLGKHGWEIAGVETLRRDQVIGRGQRVSGEATRSRYVFKRPAGETESAELGHAEQIAAQIATQRLEEAAAASDAAASHLRTVYCTGCRRQMSVRGRGTATCLSCGKDFEI